MASNDSTRSRNAKLLHGHSHSSHPMELEKPALGKMEVSYDSMSWFKAMINFIAIGIIILALIGLFTIIGFLFGKVGFK